MKTLSIDNREFVKASVLARELGYTSDYIGQLCRGKKVTAKLVGRTWYVDRTSLTEHKRNRYKKTSPKEEAHVSHVNVTAKEEDTTKVPVAIKSSSTISDRNFYTRVRQQPMSHRYDEDESDLIPLIKQTHKKLQVGLAEAKNIAISSHTEQLTFQAEERKPLRFSGSLTVAEVEDILPDDGSAEELKNHPDLPKKPTTKKEAKHQKPKRETRSLKMTSSPQRAQSVTVNLASFKTRVAVKKQFQEAVSDPTTVQLAPTMVVTNYRYSMLVACVTASFVVLLLLGLELQVTSTQEVVVHAYSFTVEDLLAAVYGSK